MGLIFEYFSRKILWEPYRLFCYLMLAVITFLYLIKPAFATLALFAYISFWSRIAPMVSDFTKDLDMIDFFAVILAINLKGPLSGLYAGIFSVFVMMGSRIFGPDEDIMITIIESIAFFFASLLTPAVYFAVNENLLLTMFIFTVQRYIYDLIIVIFFVRQLFFLACISLILGVPIAYTMNKIMIIFLGSFFSTVFETGLKFNFPLYLFGIILTLMGYYLPKYFRKRELIEQEVKKVKRKEIVTENHIEEDNMKNYPDFYDY